MLRQGRGVGWGVGGMRSSGNAAHRGLPQGRRGGGGRQRGMRGLQWPLHGGALQWSGCTALREGSWAAPGSQLACASCSFAAPA